MSAFKAVFDGDRTDDMPKVCRAISAVGGKPIRYNVATELNADGSGNKITTLFFLADREAPFCTSIRHAGFDAEISPAT